MRKISDFIVSHCYTIFIVFLVLTGICAFLSTKVKINKDIYSYMPADSETSQGLQIMDDEFDYSATSSYEIMLKGVPAEEKFQIKEEIEAVEGVSSVDYDDTDEYNRDDYTRYKINVDAPADSETAGKVYREVQSAYSEKYEMAAAGQVHDYNGAVLQIHIAVLAVAFAMIILIIMSKSWVEPFLFLFAILLAVVVNKGTNIIFPNVSHITDAIAAILQMALSMDYAIMLSTRYRQEKAKPDCKDKQTAMRNAMRYSFGAIISSSVTTVVGLLVLVLMSFTIGRDMGLVLSKGVILSLISIFTSLPALLLLFDKAIEKTTKKTINFNLTWAGKLGFNFRHAALPIFAAIFIGSFLLKGSTAIDFTASANNAIKDVFNEANQMALVYDNKMEDDVTKLCYEYDAREDTVRVLCYGNTINEPEKYNEVVPKINDLGSEKVETEDYVVKAVFYHYYKDIDNLTISLNDFVNYLQKDVLSNPNFADITDVETIDKINRFSYFTDQTKVNQPRSKSEIASILGVDEEKLNDLFVLYFADQNPTTRLTLNIFSNFVTNEVLANPNYASMITAEQRGDLEKLRLFSDASVTDSTKNSAELASLFGIEKETIDRILSYYYYSSINTPTATTTFSELANFVLSDEDIARELNLPGEKMGKYKEYLDSLQTFIAEQKTNINARFNEINQTLQNAIDNLPEEAKAELIPKITALQAMISGKINEIESFATGSYSYSDFALAIDSTVASVDNIKNQLATFKTEHSDILDQIPEAISGKLNDGTQKLHEITLAISNKIGGDYGKEDLRAVYRLYQVKHANVITASPRELVNFLLAHQSDEKLASAMTASTVSRLGLVQYIMNNQNTWYSYGELAGTFGLDAEKLKLVYALYEYRYINPNPELSLKTLINFINDKVLPNQDYAGRLGDTEQAELRTIATLMRAAEAGVQYNYDALYRAILPLANRLEKNKLFLAYLYYGSLYDYDENWTLTLEQFIDFINDKMLPDARFTSRIDDEMRDKVSDGYKTIHDAKDLLVGSKHNRALIETELPAEGEETFTFIRELKEKLGPNNKVDYFLAGDSAMAYEMSQSFGGEMDFITIITMLAIFAVVVCTFKSIFISLLLVLVIQCAVYIVMAFLSLTGSSIYFIALIIVQAILMGATIDYAILFTSYYVENRKVFHLNRKNALIQTYNKSIGAILTSALILIIVTAIVGNFTSAVAGKICQSISLGTFCATIIILTLLPALLVILDSFIVKKKENKNIILKLF